MSTEAMVVRGGGEWVDARTLHTNLGIKRMFAHWIKERVERFQLVEGKDFRILAKTGKNSGRGQPSVEYELHVVPAKMIVSTENTPHRPRVMRHLAKIETSWNDPEEVLARALVMANQTIEKKERERAALMEELQIAQPKAEFHDRLMSCEKPLGLQATARYLGRSPNLFVQTLVDDRILHRDARGKPIPYAKYCKAGLFEVAPREGNGKVRPQTMVTVKGLKALAKRYPKTDGKGQLALPEVAGD